MNSQPITYRSAVALLAAVMLLAWSSCSTAPVQKVPAPIPVDLAP